MDPTTLTLHTQFRVGPVDERIFGGFLEHMGRAVYEGVFEPGHPAADADGFRTDVLDALRGLGMTAMRYPGGNFASGYHWQDGIGPPDRRPTVRELAWQSIEPNRFGTEEYLRLCRAMGWTPMLTCNLGTGTPEEARNWVEYCNAPAGTRYADLRKSAGSPEPHGVKLWCLGNEMDGAWQLGHVPADHYAIRAQQSAKMMKDVDRSIELVACGSCGVGMKTYMEWDRVVLEHLGDLADYLSLHRYVGNRESDTADFLAVTNSIDRQIEEADAACRFVQARLRSRKRAFLCFDEWNVWYKNMEKDGHGQFAPHLIEEVYNVEDALVAAGFLNSFVRHADCVRIANIAQIVNVIAPVLTRGPDVLIQTIYFPFRMMSQRRRGVSLTPALDGPGYEGRTHGCVAFVDASAILDESADRLSVFVTNRSQSDRAPLTVRLEDRAIRALADGERLAGDDPKLANTFERPHRVQPRPVDGVRIADGAAMLELLPLSFTALSFNLA